MNIIKGTKLVTLFLAGLGIIVTSIPSACSSSGFNRQERHLDNQLQNVPSESEKELQAVLANEFGGLFDIDDRTISPTYVLGDFNGDGVEDLAIAVRLKREINRNDKSEPPFQFQKAFGPGPSTLGEPDYEPMYRLTMGDLERYRDSSMLAVVHGTLEHKFANTEPRQRFVVVDAWHLGKKRMSLFKGKLEPAPYGDEPTIVTPPDLLGDAILMIGPENSGTAVYWDGARYRWYEVASKK